MMNAMIWCCVFNRRLRPIKAPTRWSSNIEPRYLSWT